MTGLRLLAILILTTSILPAQQLTLFTQYRENATVVNPAAVEGDYLIFGQNLTLGASYRAQWTGLSGAPRTQTVRLSYLNAEGSGIALMTGGQIINDQTGPTGFTGLYGRLSGMLTDDPEYGGFAIGLSAGAVQFRVRASDIVLREDGDIIGSVDQSQFFPDVGVGLFFYRLIDGGGAFDGDYWYAGASVPQVIGLDFTFQNENGDFYTQRVQHFYGQLGLIKFFENESFLEPSVWIKYAPNAPVNVDANLRYQLPSSFWIGTGASTAGTYHLEAGFLLGQNVGFDNTIRIGYGYDYTFSTVGPSAGATHEINLGFSFFTY
jgi:type IX secretion system PorP/SprF family membrane protein